MKNRLAVSLMAASLLASGAAFAQSTTATGAANGARTGGEVAGPVGEIVGGTVGAAVGAAALINSRFLPMGVAIGPSLPGGPLRRAAQGQAIVDTSWALSSRGDGTFDRWLLFGSTAVQYVGWVAGTLVGALAGNALGNPDTYGLDAVYPAFFVALLLHELRDGRSRAVAALGGAIALALVPIAPPGVPVLAASLAALVGLTSSARGVARERL